MPFQGTASRAGRLCPFPPAGIAAPSGAAGRDGYRRLELSVPLCLRPGAGDLRQQQSRAAVFHALPAPVARQYPPSLHLSLGYLSEKNLKVLDAQFQQTYLSVRDIEDAFRDESGRLLLSRTAVSEIGAHLWADYQEFASRHLSEYDIT